MVLCIEQEQLVLDTRKLVLQSAGFEVLSALDPAQGLRLFLTEPVKAVVLVSEVEGRHGLAARMKRIKPGVPILMLSAQLAPEITESVDAVVLQGTSPALMLQTLRGLLLPKAKRKDSAA
jgi:DNA-binding response OmpR family regulator